MAKGAWLMVQNTILTVDDVRHVAKLANLQLTEEQIHKFRDQLTSVLGYMSKIQQLDTKDVIPTAQVTGLENVFRDDIVEESRMLTQEQALSNAKRTYNGYFVVDAVFG